MVNPNIVRLSDETHAIARKLERSTAPESHELARELRKVADRLSDLAKGKVVPREELTNV